MRANPVAGSPREAVVPSCNTRVSSTRFWPAVGLAATLACGGGGKAPGTTPPAAQDLSATNPDGFHYPSPPGGFGKLARTAPNPGAIIDDYAFRGYRNGDPSGGLQKIRMIDYYDPCGRRYKLIHLSVAGVWCTPCNQETDEIVAAKAQFDAQGVVMLQALDDGPAIGVEATPRDLDQWVASHHVNFTEMLDPGLMNLFGFFDAAAIPWNADVDPRTMEILDQSTGLSAAGIAQEIMPAQTAAQGPPGYPIAVSCN